MLRTVGSAGLGVCCGRKSTMFKGASSLVLCNCKDACVNNSYQKKVPHAKISESSHRHAVTQKFEALLHVWILCKDNRASRQLKTLI